MLINQQEISASSQIQIPGTPKSSNVSQKGGPVEIDSISFSSGGSKGKDITAFDSLEANVKQNVVVTPEMSHHVKATGILDEKAGQVNSNNAQSATGLPKAGKVPMFRPMNTVLRSKDSPYRDRRKSYTPAYPSPLAQTTPAVKKDFNVSANSFLSFSFRRQPADPKSPASISYSNFYSKFYALLNNFFEKNLGMNQQFEDHVLYLQYLEHMMEQSRQSWLVTDIFILVLGFVVGIVAWAILLPIKGLSSSDISAIINTAILVSILLLLLCANIIVLHTSKSLKLIHITRTITLIYFGLLSGLFNIFVAPQFFRYSIFLFYAINFATIGFPVSRIMFISLGCTAFELVTLLFSLHFNENYSFGSYCRSPGDPAFLTCGRLLAVYFISIIFIHVIGFLIVFGGDQHNKNSFLKMMEIQKETERYKAATEEAERIAVSVLPRKVWEDLRGSQRGPYRITSIFQEGNILLHHYDHVVILFGDIVGFTQLSSKLSASTLVRWLDSIFTQFDDVVEELKLEKIKTIGDCYMVCAGIPNKVDQPELRMLVAARKMIEIVEKASELKGGRLGIRIGIHAGKAWGGILGEQKLIYDVWSDDVTLAANMESSGKQGMIHVSATVMEAASHQCEFEFDKWFESEKFCIKTYFLKEVKVSALKLIGISSNNRLSEKGPTKTNLVIKSSSYIAKSSSLLSIEDQIPQKVFVEDDENFILNKSTLNWKNNFNDPDLENSYLELCARNAPPKMAIMLGSSIFLSMCLLSINIALNQSLISTTTFIAITLFQTLFCYLSTSDSFLLRFLGDQKLYFYYGICCINVFILELGVLLQVIDIKAVVLNSFVLMNFLVFFLVLLYQRIPYFLVILLLAVMTPTFFGVVYYIDKLSGETYLVLVLSFAFVLIINSFFFDRRLRLDFLNQKELLRRRLKNEDLKLKTMELLDKLVPMDVVERLTLNPNSLIADFYELTSIMFAEVKFIDSNGKVNTDLKKEQIELLHEIYTMFDRQLIIHHVEKIKSIGFVYLAIAYGEHLSAEDSIKELIRAPFYSRLANFALDIKKKVRDFSQLKNTTVQLRIGMNVGPIAAGVIGKKKLAYDVWGDSVNVASRMESTHNNDSIQISEAFYKLIQDDYDCEDRGMISVKGKGEMHLYFLNNKL